MKTQVASLVLGGLAFFGWAQDANDPFAEPKIVPMDRSADKKIDKFPGDDLLKAFEEKCLEDGVGNGSGMIRIIVLRSFHAPLVFKWFPAPPGNESLLEVKRLRMVVGKDGERTYQGLDLHQKLKLRPSQELLLKEMYQHSPLQDLPKEDWTGGGTDGSTWHYEAAAMDGSIQISRWSPINPSLEGTTITKERLSRELQLTSFALMLWALSGIDERPY